MTLPVETNLDLKGNQIMNQVGHRLAQHPSNPKEGIFYYNTTDHCFYYYNGTDWITNPDVSHFIKANSTETLTNKSISATNNTISNINTTNFANGVIVKEIGATGSDTSIPTEKAVRTEIGKALTGGLIYKGSWNATSQIDFSSIELPVKKGFMYLVTGNPTTISNVTYTAGDYIVINTDTSSTETMTQARIDKIDNTESTDITRLAASQTLTNKTINASNNTISNLETTNFKSGEIVTTLASGSTKLPTAGAVYSGLNSKAPLASPTFTGIPTAPTATAGTNTTQIATTAFVKAAVDSATSGAGTVKKSTCQNPQLVPSSGVATWTISHNLNTQDILVAIYTVTDNKKVITDVVVSSASGITISFNATETIPANTYKAILLG